MHEAIRIILADVADVMEKSGINQTELARRLDVSPAEMDTLLKLANALGIQFPPRPVAVPRSVGTFGSGQRRRGRPKGSGGIQDDERLQRMADLLATKAAKSLRSAAEMVAAEDPGHSAEATSCRLRRKFKENEVNLLKAAQKRLQRQRGHRYQRGRHTYEQVAAVPSEVNSISEIQSLIAQPHRLECSLLDLDFPSDSGADSISMTVSKLTERVGKLAFSGSLVRRNPCTVDYSTLPSISDMILSRALKNYF